MNYAYIKDDKDLELILSSENLDEALGRFFEKKGFPKPEEFIDVYNEINGIFSQKRELEAIDEGDVEKLFDGLEQKDIGYQPPSEGIRF